MPRDEFSIPVKKALALRAGYMCSICNCLTVGPSNESETSINLTGVAAHISAASSGLGARRYNTELTPEERSSISNGIWLCNTHADLIDGDEIFYTIEYLKLIKSNHEEKIRLKQSGVNIEKGLITKIELSNLGLITNPVCLEFTDKNIIVGNNGLGKTIICEFIAALGDKEYLKRWTSERHKLNSYCNIHYFKNQPDKFTISISNKNEVSYLFNSNPIPLLTPPINIFYIKESYWEFLRKMEDNERNEKSFIELISEYLNLTTTEFINVISSIIRDKKYFVNDISFNSTSDDLMIKYDSEFNCPILPFNALSSGEKERVILEIILKIANYNAKFNTTILIIENTSFPNIDYGGINHLLNLINTEKMEFQFFFTTIENPKYNTTGFKLNHLITFNGHVALQ